MAQPSHIFIVGSYRSGTSMVRSVLDSSLEAGICGETHFLDSPRTFTSLFKSCFNQLEQPDFYHKTHLLKKPSAPGSWQTLTQVGDISTEAGAGKIVDYIYERQPWRWWSNDSLDRAEFLDKLLATDRTEGAFFDLMMAAYAGDKPIRGEKTPHHIHHVPALLKWFPKAKIVHTFRDVRAVFVSQQKKKLTQERERLSPRQRLFRRSAIAHEAYMSLNVIIHWLRVVQLHRQYQQLFPDNYYFCRFEDLIGNPKLHLGKLCDYLEVELTETMLEQSVQNSSFLPRRQVQGFDTSVVDRWREHLDPAINRWFIFWSKKYLLELGYPL